MKQVQNEFHLGNGDFVNVKTSSTVTLNEQFIVYTDDGPITLNVSVNADFATIDKKYHEIFFNVLCAKYMNKVSFGENPFSECKPMVMRKWWQFWKPKYITSQTD